jgi:Ni,Fe-hydrogenase maturation factor
MDPHSPALTESLLVADLTGEGPTEVLLVGVSGESYNATEGLSDVVRNAVDNAITAVLAELDRLGGEYRRKEKDDVPQIWWESSAAEVLMMV